MQDRYAGDIGDYLKLALLRELSPGRRLGVAWYLVPDESHNTDGRHIPYLDQPKKWRHYDPPVFDALSKIVKTGKRSVSAIEKADLLPGAVYAGSRFSFDGLPIKHRPEHRTNWIERCLETVDGCDVVFADPDNGLEPGNFKPNRKKAIKSITFEEIAKLGKGRPLVIYHHLTRRRGGHEAEIDYQMNRLGTKTIAVRARAYSPRVFLITNPDKELVERANRFRERWSRYVMVRQSR